jgi:4-hydroxy-tetrahydrodipicolinate synthase
MAQICHAMPKTFAVLSGDDAVTLPLMALGGVGLISVASNEIPGEMAQLCDACLKGDFAAAREIHTRYLPLMEVNFVESSPGPVKAAMAMMGLLEPHYRLPIVAPRAESRARVEKVLHKLGLLAPIAASAD